jgi:hypothetical protein
MAFDYDGLDEFFDRGAYHKHERFQLSGLLAGFSWRKLERHIPFIIAILYFASGDYISLFRHLQTVI